MTEILLQRSEVTVTVTEPTAATVSVSAPTTVTVTAGATGPQGAAGAAGPAGTASVFSRAGTLSTVTGSSRLYFERAGTITFVRASVGTPPTGGPVVVDVKRNGSSIFATTGDRPTIAAGTHTDLGNPSTVQIVPGDYVTVDITTVGTSFAGADLTVTLTIE